MESEPLDNFEVELREALERRPAPPGLKRKLMQRRSAKRPLDLSIIWRRLAASILLAALVSGGFVWRHREEQRQGEAARQQVLIALRITSHALNQVQSQLAAHDHANKE